MKWDHYLFFIKEKYRDLIREGNGNVKFLFLEGTFELVLERMKQRKGHYMKTDMLRVSLRHWKYQVR